MPDETRHLFIQHPETSIQHRLLSEGGSERLQIEFCVSVVNYYKSLYCTTLKYKSDMMIIRAGHDLHLGHQVAQVSCLSHHRQDWPKRRS